MFRRFAIFFVSSLYVSIAFGGGVIPPKQDPNKIEWVPGEVLVKFKDEVKVHPVKGYNLIRTGIASVDALNRRYKVREMEKVFKTAEKRKEKKYIKTYTGEVIEVPQLFNWYELKVSDDADIKSIVDAYKDDPNVEYAEPNYIARICVEPDDSLFGEQWGLPAIHAPEAWDIEKGDSTVIIGILDTGVEWDHPDLTGNILNHGYDFVNDDNDAMDDNGHGTHCAGIAAAVTDNSIGIAGAAWNCKILPVKVLQSNGTGSYSDIAAGAAYAADSGAKVINMSLGGYAKSSVLRDALENAYTTTVIVAAAGNDGCAVEPPCCNGPGIAPFFPAAWPFVIGVEAGVSGGGLAGFSNCDPNGPVETNSGLNYEVRAPGVNIYSTLPEFHPHGYTYASWNGTSMAAPFVTGTVALLRSHYPSWSNELIMGQLIYSSDPMINAYQSLIDVAEPQLALYSHIIIDTLPGDDQDGIADAGETVEMAFDIQNTWGQAYNVEAKLRPHSYEDTMFITILDSTATFGSVSPYAHVTNNTNPFEFSVKSSTPNNIDIYFDYEITCDGGYSFPGTFYITAQRGIEVSGIISSNTTWASDYLYIVTANVLVDTGVTLTILPGTRIQVDDLKYIMIDGCLVAIGTEDSMVTFALNSGPNGWGGIRFTDKSVDAVFDADSNYVSGSIIKYVEIEHSNTYGISVDKSSPYIAFNFIHDNAGTGVRVKNSSNLRIEYNLLRGNNHSAIYLYEMVGTPIIAYNVIEDNKCTSGYGGGISVDGCGCGSSMNSIITHNVIRGSRHPAGEGIYVNSGNPVITYNSISDNGGQYEVQLINNYYAINVTFLNNTVMYGSWDGYGVDGIVARLSACSLRFNNVICGIGHEYAIRSGQSDINVPYNYWSTTNTDSIDEWIWDRYDDFDLGEVFYEPFDSTPVVTAPGFLYQVEFNPLPPIGVEVDTFTLIFSKPMDTAIQPKVSFGVCDPWTQHIIEGDWIDSTHWQGTYTFNIMTGDGINHLRATTAKDCEAMEIPKDTRFSFVVDAAGASSIGFIAQAGIKKVDLLWPKPELVDLMGYNMYRYQQLTDTTVSDTILVNNQLILDTAYTDTAVNADTTYFYMFTAISTDFNESDYSKCVSATPYGPGAEERELLPKKYVLFQNFPNPIQSKTRIEYGLPTTSKVSLRIYNIAGQEICTLVDQNQKPGYYTIAWNGKDRRGRAVASGIYFYRLEAGDFKATRKLTILR